MERCKYCSGLDKLKIHRKNNIMATQCYICKEKSDADGTLVIENTNGLPAYIDINFCPVCGKDMRG